MLKVLLFSCLSIVLGQHYDWSSNQLPNFKKKTSGPVGVLTTSSGTPVDYNEATSTLNTDLLTNEYFLDSITNLVRERVPERVVHPKGIGALGYFEVTHNISHVCKAKFLNKVGKRTPVVSRFSLGFAERGTSDTTRHARGLAVKFYTEEGNFDFVGLSTPMYSYKNPVLFAALTHALKRNPSTNLIDPNTFWDFLTVHPEAIYIFLLILGDRGIPDGYRHMPGFTIHTYILYNKAGKKSYCRFHLLPDAGLKTLNSTEANRVGLINPDYASKDLYDAIAGGNFPSWTLSIQILTSEDVKKAGFDVFDVTKVLPINRYPLHPIGKLVLNKNSLNQHAQNEQAAYCPGNVVPGILGSPDKLFKSRRLFYRDAQNYRLGPNFNKIPVNCPMNSKAFTYNRDGMSPVNDNGKDYPNYFPNSFNGPNAKIEKNRPRLPDIIEEEPNNFEQASDLYENGMDYEEKLRLVENIVEVMCPVTDIIKKRALRYFYIINPDLGSRVAEGLKEHCQS